MDSVTTTRDALQTLRDFVQRRIIGQDQLVERLLVALLADGHLLVEGPPGLAKTRAIKVLSEGIEGEFHRIQFTPDLLPADLTGTEIYRPQDGSFVFQQGPLFHNLVLADEVNRAPAKVQSALLEAMAERQITIGRVSYPLPPMFMVMATQNPLEQEGTYPLPEAQQDRFMFKIKIRYPSYEEEYAVAERTTTMAQPELSRVLNAEDVIAFQHLTRRVPAAPDVIRHALDLVRATRPEEPDSPAVIREMITWGAGPRAVQALILAGKARAVLQGRHHAGVEDVRAVVHPIMRHRIVVNFSAEARGYTTDRIVDELLTKIDPHRTDLDGDGQIRKVLSA